MSDMKCPFCQQELDCMGKYTDGSSKWLCNKCGLFGDKKLFDEIIRTRKALDVAVRAIQTIKYSKKSDAINLRHKANKALIDIYKIKDHTALEQKD